MDKEAFQEKIKEIGSYETIEEVRAGLAELNDGVGSVYDSNISLTEENEKIQKENEAIRQANMKLFTRLGSDKTPEEKTEEQTGLKQEPVERRKFSDLYDDNGNFIKK